MRFFSLSSLEYSLAVPTEHSKQSASSASRTLGTEVKDGPAKTDTTTISLNHIFPSDLLSRTMHSLKFVCADDFPDDQISDERPRRVTK